MYDFDQDHEIDNEWKDFLNEFMMPLTSVEDDDEKSDPEYIAAEKVPLDKEELRPVRVSKKELNQLISELLEDSSNLFSDPEPSTSSSYKRNSSEHQLQKNKRHRLSSPPRHKSQSPKISSRLYSPQELLHTPPRFEPSTSSIAVSTPQRDRRKDSENIPVDLNSTASSFFQHQLQTPQRIEFSTPTVQTPTLTPLLQSPAVFFTPTTSPLHTPTTTPSDGARVPQITGVYGSAPSNVVQSLQPPAILVMNAQNQLEIRSSSNLINQAFFTNGVVQLPQFQSVVVQVPTIDLLQNRFNASTAFAQPLEADVAKPNEPIETSAEAPTVEPLNLTDDKKTRLKRG
jgi:hypothetical protein